MGEKHIPITLERIADRENLRLALIRISQTEPNRKIWNDRTGIHRFWSDVEKNLESFSKQILDGYKASFALKVYMPKSFVHTRVFSILSVRDEILYQAISNLLAQNAYSDLKSLQKHNSFGNRIHPHVSFGTEVLKGGDDYSNNFFDYQKTIFENWKEFTDTTNEEIRKHRGGYKFETDITSFYDSIPLDQLLNVIRGYGLDNDSSDLLFNCLNQWTGIKRNLTPSVGIPTGPIASHLFANIYLMPIDLQMIKPLIKIAYLRYVDDFRLFTMDENLLWDVAPRLGILLRGLGLNLKSSKTTVEKIDEDLTLAQYFGDASSIDNDETFIVFDHEGKGHFNKPNDLFIDDKDYQTKNIKILEKDIKGIFNIEDGNIKIKKKDKFLKKKNDGVLSQLLSTYKRNIIKCIKKYNFNPDGELIDIIFYLIDEIPRRSHVYIPFLSIYQSDLGVRNRIFDLLSNRMMENMEWVRYLIYETLFYFEINQNQKEYLLSIFPKEEFWAAEKLYELLTMKCFNHEENIILSVNKMWEEKCKKSPIQYIEHIEEDHLRELIILNNGTTVAELNKFEETDIATYKEKKKPICIKLETINPDDLSKEEKELFYSKSWQDGHSRYFREIYRDRVLPSLITYLRADDRLSIHSNEVPTITGVDLSPFWRAVAIRSLQESYPREVPQSVIEDYKTIVTDEEGNNSPKKDVLKILIKKVPK